MAHPQGISILFLSFPQNLPADFIANPEQGKKSACLYSYNLTFELLRKWREEMEGGNGGTLPLFPYTQRQSWMAHLQGISILFLSFP